jgi:hypothetical protein
MAAIDIARQLPEDAITHAFSEWLYDELPDSDYDTVSWRVYSGMVFVILACGALAWPALFRDAKETAVDMEAREIKEQEPRTPTAPLHVPGDMLPGMRDDNIKTASFFFRGTRWLSGLVSAATATKTILSFPVQGSPWWGWGFGLASGAYALWRSIDPMLSYPTHNADHPINNPARVLPTEQFSPARQSRAWRAVYQLARFGLPLATVQPNISSILDLIPAVLQHIGMHPPFEIFMPLIRFGGGIGFYFPWQSIEGQFLLPNLNAHFRRNPAELELDWRAAGFAASFSTLTYFWYFRFFGDFQFRYPVREVLAMIPAIASVPGLYYQFARCLPRQQGPYISLDEQNTQDEQALQLLTTPERARAEVGVAPYQQRLVMIERGRLKSSLPANDEEQPATAANNEAKQRQRIELIVEGDLVADDTEEAAERQPSAAEQLSDDEVATGTAKKEIKSTPTLRSRTQPTSQSSLREQSFFNARFKEARATVNVVREESDTSRAVAL